MVLNTNLLFNCYEDADIYEFNLIYNITDYNVASCIEKGESCEFVCKEFKFGTASDMFIGRLSYY